MPVVMPYLVKVEVNESVAVAYANEYFVVARSTRGGRIISPNLNWEKAVKTYVDYKSVVSYFGGGTVTMYERNIDDYDVVIFDDV